MATAILRPQDCLRPQACFDPFSTPKPISNRRRPRPVRSIQSTPSPQPKHGRPNRKSSSSSPLSSPPRSASPPSSSSSSSSSPVQDGFRLLKRGEALLAPPQPKQELSTSPTNAVPFLRRSEHKPTARAGKTSPPKKTQSDRVKPELTTTVARPIPVGSDIGSMFAGPNFAVCAPEACCLPQPMYLLRSTSTGPASDGDDEASKTLRSLLKLQCL